MKRIAYTAVVIFWSVIATLVIVAQLAPRADQATAATDSLISPVDLAAHATPGDCWIAVGGQVYDVTTYIPLHPTPPAVITDWCGKDATQAFETKGYGRPHSSAAWEMLAHYRVGTMQTD